jgi:hypothetical protein
MLLCCRCRGYARQALGSALRGQVPLRTWLVVAYLVILHVLVMLSFSRRHDACPGSSPGLPG